MAHRPQIAVITTGGTIDLLGDDRLDLSEYGDRGRWIDPETLLARLPELEGIADCRVTEFDRIGVSSMGSAEWLRLARVVEDVVRAGADGVVITHGTNALEETAYFLSLVLKVGCPVVVTGAMRPASGLSSDGDLNLVNAVRVACSKAASSKGVLVVLNDLVHAARDVTKTSTHAVETFRSRNWGPLGLAGPDGIVVFHRSPSRKHTMDTPFLAVGLERLPRVDVVLSYWGSDGTAVDCFVAAGASGLVSAGFGAGRPAPDEKAALDRAVSKGVIVVQGARGGEGQVVEMQRLQEARMVAATDLTPWKARILLMLALTVSRDVEDIRAMFREY